MGYIEGEWAAANRQTCTGPILSSELTLATLPPTPPKSRFHFIPAAIHHLQTKQCRYISLCTVKHDADRVRPCNAGHIAAPVRAILVVFHLQYVCAPESAAGTHDPALSAGPKGRGRIRSGCQMRALICWHGRIRATAASL
jgi:hypothetical protein